MFRSYEFLNTKSKLSLRNLYFYIINNYIGNEIVIPIYYMNEDSVILKNENKTCLFDYLLRNKIVLLTYCIYYQQIDLFIENSVLKN